MTVTWMNLIGFAIFRVEILWEMRIQCFFIRTLEKMFFTPSMAPNGPVIGLLVA